MPDKLLVEIDMHNSELEDAVPALIFLAHELAEAGTIEISRPINWNEKQSNKYQVKWRFSEDELHIPFDVDFLSELNDELKHFKGKKKNSALKSLQNLLESCLAENRIELFCENS